MLPTPRPKRRHCAPGTLHLSQLTTARKTAQPTGHAQRSTRQCAQNRTPALYTPRSTRLPLRARPHASRVRATLSLSHCTQSRTASRVRTTLNPPVTARKTARQPGRRNAQPARHCALNRTARWAGATLSPRPLCARSHASRVRATLSLPHCTQSRTASRVRASSARLPVRTKTHSQPDTRRLTPSPLRAKPHSPSGIRHAQPVAGDVKTSQSRLT